MKTGYLILISLLLAVAASAAFIRDGALDNLLFRAGLFDRERESKAIDAERGQYNAVSSAFYGTAGEFTAGLDEIPAAPMLKRRLFKDINMLKGDGLVMVFDRDRDELKRVYFINRDLAVAEAEEVWGVNIQDVKTRRPVYNLKAVDVKVRYLFHREPFRGKGKRWIAHKVDVYPMDQEIPEFEMKTVFGMDRD